MSRQGHKLAIQIGLPLPVHKTKEEAERHYFSFRDKALKEIEKLAIKYPVYDLDFSPESLKRIELLYFDLLEQKVYSKHIFFGLTITRMEQMLAVYYGQVYVQNTAFIWVAKEFGYIEDRYYLAVQSQNKGLTLECSSFSDHFNMNDNKRKQYIYREYKKYSKYA